MFDFSRLGDTISDLVGGLAGAGEASPQNVLELMQQAGIDPSALTGLTQSEAITFLTENGIDPSQLVGGQLDELLAGLGVSGPLADLAAGWLDSEQGNSES